MRSALLLAAALASASASAPARGADAAPAGAKPAAPAKPLSAAETEKALYALGLDVANSLEPFNLSPAELEIVLRGLRDGWAGKPKIQLDAKLQEQVNALARAGAAKAAEKVAARDREADLAYLDRVSKEKGARRTPSGAIVVPEKVGSGPSPTPADRVRVGYTGTLVSGRVFDSTAQRGPVEFELKSVITCWAEAIPLMKVGGKARIVCPPDIAYGASGRPGIPPNATLVFDVELLAILK